jgi:hypothetical protein
MKRFALGLLLALATTAHADDRADLAQKHYLLAKKLEKPGCWHEMRAELLLAIELDPDNKDARFKLGYKREGDSWKGAGMADKKSRAEPSSALQKEIYALHGEAASRLAEAALAAKKNGDEATAHALAGLALDEDAQCAPAREVLGHERKYGNWASPRERKVRQTFFDAIDAAKKDEPPARAGDESLEKLLELGPLDRRESETFVFLSTKAAKADLVSLARTIDEIRHAWAELVPRPEVEGDAAAVTSHAKTKARWLVVAPSEHAKFVDHAVKDESRRPLCKQLGSFSGFTQAANQDVYFLYECSHEEKNRPEWAALTAVKTLIQQNLPQKAPPPGFLVEGLARFFAGRTTGRVDISFVTPRATLTVHERSSVDFDTLRVTIRAAIAQSPEGFLRGLVNKSLNELEDQDSQLALAFVEFLLAKKPKEVARYLGAVSPSEPAPATLERVLGASPEEVERELRAWAREEY